MSVNFWSHRRPSPFDNGKAASQPRIGILPAMIVGLVAFMGTCSLLGFMVNIADQASLADHVSQTRDVPALQTALSDAEIDVRSYVATGDLDDLSAYLGVTKTIEDNQALLRVLDRYVATQLDAKAGPTPVSDAVAEMRANWQSAARLMRDNQSQQAMAALQSSHSKELIEKLRGYVGKYISQRTIEAAAAQERIDFQHIRLLIINMSGALIAIGTMIYAFYSSARQASDRDLAIAEGRAAHKQVEQLFFMADMLQSSNDQDDTNAVLCSAAGNMLPGFSGAMYMFNNSRDRLDLATQWGGLAADSCVDHFGPNSCWALKRGKANMNRTESGALRCSHVAPDRVTLEIPMVARGQLHGLIEIIGDGPDADARLNRIRPIAAAMGDAMSLALSSMALRERLRNQALRDALTGLYNRRFLEETLERVALDSERRKSPVSAIMIDLDHFKRLNDVHGHAAGDTVLREVAKAIVMCLRQTDVACRYGGEEIAVLMPDCPLAMAEKKAEQIRARIAEVSGGEGLSVTASLGVSAHPETSGRTELLSMADAALYEAKQRGRDRVVVAPIRSFAQKLTVVEGGSASAI
jgi:diguanylate cyclase (GGDEF)-like protein